MLIPPAVSGLPVPIDFLWSWALRDTLGETSGPSLRSSVESSSCQLLPSSNLSNGWDEEDHLHLWQDNKVVLDTQVPQCLSMLPTSLGATPPQGRDYGDLFPSSNSAQGSVGPCVYRTSVFAKTSREYTSPQEHRYRSCTTEGHTGGPL